jgi:hypothetical protein
MFDLNADIQTALMGFPSLIRCDFRSIPTLKGSFTAYDKATGIEIETYQVLITFPNSYPRAFPTVWETAGKIKRHLLNNGSLCFGNPQDVGALSKNGISLKWFLEEILNAHLCREYVREKDGDYPTGERSHDYEGVWEGYYEVLGTTNKAEILRQLSMVLSHGRVGSKGPCYCGSGKMFQNCHQRKEEAILRPGHDMAVLLYTQLQKSYNSRP